jgi:transposase
LLKDALLGCAAGTPVEIWFQMLWGRALPGLTGQTGRHLQLTQGALPAMLSENIIRIAIELSASSWLVAVRLPGADKSRLHRLEGGDTTALLALISQLRSTTSTKCGKAVDVACCFEAGRDGFWLHRLLTAHGIATYVLEPTSILVNRRARRAKTDRLDAEGMLHVLAAWLAGDRQVCSMVRVPTPEEEDAKRPHREREHLVKERLRIENRISALLFTQGIRKRPSLRSWERDMAELRTGDGRALPPLLQTELNRLRRRLVLTLELIRELEVDRAETQAATTDDAVIQKITALQRIRGVGENFSNVLVREVLYRSFDNRRQLASYVGIAPMPYQSGGMDLDRSISRAGNPRARTTLIQLAWLWLRYQPGSALATWFRERVGTLQGRTRRIAIVAMARKLLIALWRYVETGMLPDGVELSTPAVVPAA